MKGIWSITVACVGLASIARYAAAQDGGVAAIGPRLITYQGLVENAGGPIDNQSMVVEFRAFPTLTGGTQRGLTVYQELLSSAVRKGVFSVEMDADDLALPDNADETFLEVAVCSPAPCTPVVLAPRHRVTHAALAVSARNLGGAAFADEFGALRVEGDGVDAGILRASRDIGAGVVQEMGFDAATGAISTSRTDGNASALALRSTASASRTEAVIDDALSEMRLNKVNLAATAATTTDTLRFNAETGEVAAASNDSAPAPLRLSSKNPANSDRTYMLVDHAAAEVSFAREVDLAATAGLTPPPKLVFNFAATSNVALANPAVSIAAFNGTNAAALQLKSGNDAVMSYDPAVGEAMFSAAAGVRADRFKIGGTALSNVAGPAPSAELSVNGTTGNVELKVGVEIVDRWTPVGDTANGPAPNRMSGSSYNQVTSGAFGAVIGGGGNPSQPNQVTSYYGTIGGGYGNTASGNWSTLGGGALNTASNFGSTVGGGQSNIASGIASTVGGGNGSISSGNGSTVGGGNGNTATDVSSTVGGGLSNHSSGYSSTVGGGWFNTANSISSTVGGGYFNTASGGYSTVGGGAVNTAIGYSSTVPGGAYNQAGGDYSFAAGRSAKVRDAAAVGGGDTDGDEGTFVWADSTGADFTSTAANQFFVRASGGTTFYSDTALTAGVTLAAGGSAWAAVSDRNLKENFAEVDRRAVLDRLAETPITTWNYKSQEPSIRHMGPMGQDFHAAFGIGEEETRITTIDADGVALAAIQGLYEIVREKDCRIGELEDQNTELQSRFAALETLVSKLAAQQNGGGR